jgi:hypothetical protein
VKVLDQALWQERRAALSADETGRAFLAFLESWTDAAEDYLDFVSNSSIQFDLTDPGYKEEGNPAYALNRKLALVEDTHGRVAAHYLGQMMAVLAMHWHYGAVMMEALTPIERRLVEDMTAMKIAHEMQKADQAGD